MCPLCQRGLPPHTQYQCPYCKGTLRAGRTQRPNQAPPLTEEEGLRIQQTAEAYFNACMRPLLEGLIAGLGQVYEKR